MDINLREKEKLEEETKENFKESFLTKGKQAISLVGLSGKKLQTAYSRKEKIENLIEKLENLRKENATSDSQYNKLKAEYNEFYSQSIEDIQKIKNEFQKSLQEKRASLKVLYQNLENLETRFKVEELTKQDYQKSKQVTEKKIQKAKKEASRLQIFLDSKCSTDLGGYLDVPIDKSKSGALLLALLKIDGIKALFQKKIVITAILFVIILFGGMWLLNKEGSASPVGTVRSFYGEVNKGNTMEATTQYFPRVSSSINTNMDKLAWLEGKIKKVEITDQKIGKGIEEGYGDVYVKVILKDGVKEQACNGMPIYDQENYYLCNFKENRHVVLEKMKSGWIIVEIF